MIRRTKYDLEQSEKKAHILRGLIIAIDNLDAVIKTIKESNDVETARTRLIERFKLSKLQAQAILDSDDREGFEFNLFINVLPFAVLANRVHQTAQSPLIDLCDAAAFGGDDLFDFLKNNCQVRCINVRLDDKS